MNAITDEPARRGLTLARRWMLALGVVVSTAAVLAGAAAADQPNVLERNHAYVREVPHAATCKPYGYAFTVSFHYDVRRTITEFVDDDGNVLREVIEASSSERRRTTPRGRPYRRTASGTSSGTSAQARGPRPERFGTSRFPARVSSYFSLGESSTRFRPYRSQT
jgi:hypothetical protein